MKLYHLSTNPNLSTMIPRIPQNRLTYKGIENNIIKRVCFSNSINSALASAPPVKTGVILYVYSPVSFDKKFVYKPSPKEVPDVNRTHEVWYLAPVNVKKIGAIIVGDIIRAHYWKPEERKNHFDLEWYTYKELKNPNDKKEIDRYLRKQPIYQKQLKNELNNKLYGGAIGATLGALAALSGVAIYSLGKAGLKRVK